MAGETRTICFTLNGKQTSVDVGSHENLVEVLRRLDLTGARESCGQGLCGCCTVVVDKKPVSGCLFPAPLANGRDVRTVEALDANGELDPVQQAFIEEGAFQCGFCTPGFVLMVGCLLKEQPDPTEEGIRNYLAGNLCRCAAYPEIIRAVRNAANKLKRRSHA